MTNIQQNILAKQFIDIFRMAKHRMKDPRKCETQDGATKEYTMDSYVLPHPVYVSAAESVGCNANKSYHTYNR